MKKEINEEKETKITISFGEEGISVEGVSTSRWDHVIGTLAMISSLVNRCGGDAGVVNEAISTLVHSDDTVEEEEKKEPEIKIKKLDLSDKDSVEEFIKLLKKASSK